jgi:hypothetical protein
MKREEILDPFPLSSAADRRPQLEFPMPAACLKQREPRQTKPSRMKRAVTCPMMKKALTFP